MKTAVLALLLVAAGSAVPSHASQGQFEVRASETATSAPGTQHEPVCEENPHCKFVRGVVQEVIHPNRDIRQPEDAGITSIVISPRFTEDETVFAAGNTYCLAYCPNVLFRSTDGGATWTRLRARRFTGVDLLLPPDFGAGDDRIFAMGGWGDGLQVSVDGGKSFERAALTGGPPTWAATDISPGFNDGDPSILIGNGLLLRYRDDLRTLEPVVSSAGKGPFIPTYSPSYAEDETVFLGTTQPDPVSMRPFAVVIKCVAWTCEPISIPEAVQEPEVLLSEEYDDSGLIHAFTGWGIYVSASWGGGFERIETPWDEDIPLWDLAVDPSGSRLVAAVGDVLRGNPDSGLYISDDGGATWVQSDDSILSEGATQVELAGDRMFVALKDSGVACSSDGGSTWASRCD